MKRPGSARNLSSSRRQRAWRTRQVMAWLLVAALICNFTESLQRVPVAQGDAVMTSINVCETGSAAAKGTGQTPCLPQVAYAVELPAAKTGHPQHPPACARMGVVPSLERPPKTPLSFA